MEVKVYDPEKGKTLAVGTLVDGVYTRRVEDRHYMRKYQGYGIQEDMFQDLIARGCTHIKLMAPGDVFLSPIGEWIAHGIVADEGHGQQRFLAKKYMEVL